MRHVRLLSIHVLRANSTVLFIDLWRKSNVTAVCTSICIWLWNPWYWTVVLISCIVLLSLWLPSASASSARWTIISNILSFHVRNCLVVVRIETLRLFWFSHWSVLIIHVTFWNWRDVFILVHLLIIVLKWPNHVICLIQLIFEHLNFPELHLWVGIDLE